VLSDRAAGLRHVLNTRAQMVGQRAELVTMLRGQWQAQGLAAPKCGAENFARRLRAGGSEAVRAVHVQSALAVLDALGEQIKALDAQLRGLSEKEEAFERLITVPGVGLIVGLAFIAALDEAARFRNARQVGTYLGLVPRERTTGGRQQLGRITKAGNPMARWTLVQAAHVMLGMKRCANDPLVVWAQQVAGRRGKRVAAVAVARRLAGILWAMWRDGTSYDAAGLGRASAAGLARRERQVRREAERMASVAMEAAQMQ
jgi:transposase